MWYFKYTTLLLNYSDILLLHPMALKLLVFRNRLVLKVLHGSSGKSLFLSSQINTDQN